MTTIRVELDERSYDIRIVSGDRTGLGAFARQRCKGSMAFVVSDEHVSTHADAAADALATEGFRPMMAVIPSGEVHKSLSTANYLYDALAEVQADMIGPLAGGLGDLGGAGGIPGISGIPGLPGMPPLPGGGDVPGIPGRSDDGEH